MPYTENEGIKIYWDERGAGQPLLLINGTGIHCGPDLWYGLMPALRHTTARYYSTIVARAQRCAPGIILNHDDGQRRS